MAKDQKAQSKRGAPFLSTQIYAHVTINDLNWVYYEAHPAPSNKGLVRL